MARKRGSKQWKALRAVLMLFASCVLLAACEGVSAFQPASGSHLTGQRIRPSPSYISCSLPTTRRNLCLFDSSPNKDDNKSNLLSDSFRTVYSVAGICSAAAWIALSITALSHHPDPRFINCSLKHNVLTMTQAFAFPLPVIWAAFRSVSSSDDESSADTLRRLNLGIATTFLYAAVATFWAPSFACGYDLYSPVLKVVAGSIFSFTSALSLTAWKRSAQTSGIFSSVNRIVRGSISSLWSIAPLAESSSTAALYATGTFGFLWFTFLPLVSDYPLLTIPTILGKRLSRAAGAFTFLGAVMAYSLKDGADKKELDKDTVYTTLRRGLGWGSSLHLILVTLKLIGVDD